MKIPVVCNHCDFVGQLVVKEKDKNKYRCPDCGHRLKKGEGTYIYFSERSVSKKYQEVTKSES